MNVRALLAAALLGSNPVSKEFLDDDDWRYSDTDRKLRALGYGHYPSIGEVVISKSSKKASKATKKKRKDRARLIKRGKK